VSRNVRPRPSTLLLLLGLMLGLTAPVALPTPASARSAALDEDPLCYTSGWSVPPGINNPLPVTWSHIGTRSNGGFAYRYWMKTENGYYVSSLVAKCSGRSLVSTTAITPTSGSGTPACTSSADRYPTGSDAERYVGQAAAWERGYVYRPTFRYWHREWLLVATPGWSYRSSFVVRC
jgi:hypothetical protein